MTDELILNKSSTVWGPGGLGQTAPVAPLLAALVTKHLGSVLDTVIEHLKARFINSVDANGSYAIQNSA